MSLTKTQRAALREKFGGRCAYCGRDLPEKGWHADHVEPVLRYTKFDHDAGKFVQTGELLRPANERPDNYFPSCAACNNYKASFSVEFFRKEIAAQVERARKSSMNFRTAERFGLVESTGKDVVFWFEQYADAGSPLREQEHDNDQ